jgi:hypothetical protein
MQTVTNTYDEMAHGFFPLLGKGEPLVTAHLLD